MVFFKKKAITIISGNMIFFISLASEKSSFHNECFFSSFLHDTLLDSFYHIISIQSNIHAQHAHMFNFYYKPILQILLLLVVLLCNRLGKNIQKERLFFGSSVKEVRQTGISFSFINNPRLCSSFIIQKHKIYYLYQKTNQKI